MEDSNVHVLLVPFPISPLVAYAYFLGRKFGQFRQEVEVRYLSSSGGERDNQYFGEGTIRLLSSRRLYENLDGYLRAHHHDRYYDFKRLLTYCDAGDRRMGEKFRKWLLRRSLLSSQPKKVLEEAEMVLGRAIGADPWKHGLSCENFEEEKIIERKNDFPADLRIGALPIFPSHKPGEDEVIASVHYELSEGKILSLCQESIGVMIGGEAGSGKSTLTVSLAAEIDNILQSLRTRPWPQFSLKTELINLDLATPTSEAIQAGRGKDRSLVSGLKRPWNTILALEAMEVFRRAKERANLVVADLPGGKPDHITEITAALADVAVIVTRDWEGKMKEWTEFVNRMGITLVAQVRSRLPTEGLASVVTRYNPGGLVVGRVVSLDRIERSWDRFIVWLAEFLLFDILPSLVERRKKKIERLLSEV